jgi:hypothetical protein
MVRVVDEQLCGLRGACRYRTGAWASVFHSHGPAHQDFQLGEEMYVEHDIGGAVLGMAPPWRGVDKYRLRILAKSKHEYQNACD